MVAVFRSSRFDILNKLGEGGMGVVYEAYDRERQMKVALKTMRQLEASTLYHFKREFRAISDLSHPNIVSLYELIADDRECYFTMEVVHGDDILSHVRADRSHHVLDASLQANASPQPSSPQPPADQPDFHTEGETRTVPPEPVLDERISARSDVLSLFDSFNIGPLPFIDDIVDMRRVRAAFGQLARALWALHQVGLVHRDLKPSNVRVTESGRVVLMDFGIVAPESRQRNRIWSRRAVGTPAYMAPEQARGAPASAAADWYAFGVMLYEALTARRPFTGAAIEILRAKMWQRPTPVGRLVQGLPANLHSVCIRLLDKEAERRPGPEDILRCLDADSPAEKALAAAWPRQAETGVFVGREDELDLMRRAYGDARAGEQSWLFLSGETGMGKTTLVRRFLAEILGRQRGESSGDHLEPEIGDDDKQAPATRQKRAQSLSERISLTNLSDDEPVSRAGPLVLRGRCHERETLAYNVFDGIVDSLSHTLMATSNAHLAAVLPDDIEFLARLFPVLRRVPTISVSAAADAIEPRESRFRAAVALRDLLCQLSQRRPIVIHIDDMHWADGDSLDLLAHLATSTGRPDARPHLCFIGTLRTLPDDSEVGRALARLSAHPHVQHRTLTPLAPAERAELRRQLGAADSDGSPVSESVWEDTGGIPLFMVELSRYVTDSGPMPADRSMDLDDVLYQRIARLPDDARHLLEAVCVAVDPLPLRMCADVVHLQAEPGERALTYLRGRKLVQVQKPVPEHCLSPYHDRVRDAVLGHLDAHRRTKLHRRLARQLRTWEHARLGALAHHWGEAGYRQRARRYLVEAAELAQAKLAFDRAAALYQQAVDLAPTTPLGEETYDLSESSLIYDGMELFDEEDGALRLAGDEHALLCRLANALRLAGRSFEAAGIYERAAQNTTAEDALVLRRLAAESWLRSGHMTRGIACLSEVFHTLGARYPRTRASAIAILVGRRLRLAWRGRNYRRRLAEELSRAETARSDTLYAGAVTLGMLDYIRGAALQAFHLSDSLRMGDERRIHRALAVESMFLGTRPGRTGARGRALADEVLEWARSHGDTYLLGLAQMFRGSLFFFSGAFQQSIRALREADAVMSTVHEAVEWERVTARYALCLALVAVGDFAAAARTAERYTAVAEGRNDIYARSIFMCIPTTWWLLCQDRPEDADANLATVLAGWPDDRIYTAHYLEAFCRALIALYRGDGQAANRELDRAEPMADHLMLTKLNWVRTELHTLRARAALLVDDRRRARRSLRVVARGRMRYTDGIAALLRATLSARDGDRDGTVTQLELALPAFEDCSATHLAASCSVRLGHLLGDERGRDLHEHGMAQLGTCGAQARARMLDCLSPGFPDEAS